jgi:hypothetical protein
MRTQAMARTFNWRTPAASYAQLYRRAA